MITAFYAALLGLIFFALTVFVIKGRFKYRVSLGDGGQEEMQRRIRVQANFAELVPFSLLLMMLSEMQGLPLVAVHVLGVSLLTGRLLHIWGLLTKEGASFGRTTGMILTGAVIVASSLWLLYKTSPNIF